MADRDTRLTWTAGFASVAVSAILVGLKLWALSATGALSIAASLADSALDLMMSIAAATALVYAALPADEDHAFGHSSAEDLAALAQSLFILVSAGLIGWSAVHRLMTPEPTHISDEGLGIAVMLISMALTLVLVWWQGRVAKLTGSKVVAADRLHYLGDLLPGIGAVLALYASSKWGVTSIDGWVALAAALVMAYGAVGIGRGAWDALMDRRADPQIIASIAEIASNWPGVHGFHDLKTRTAGRRIFVHLHIELDGEQSLREAHEIGAGLRRAILLAYPQADVIIHKDVAPTADHPGT
ncbi:cation diffusion facilitator family transporter [Xinfangfangia sp. CPCC 101601]|uniref:Cation diffusion facilitator family transporter n=1 Tax=Pseudogemmobacter lacusdianii TaxID=3069608 RepID=A0ABU0VWI1_9RHOB|nr:cation diffusion facilitator family transporter [Xinfangfangia sp. CPCC 101601]MDQ2066107.1 cation diffusion facilitator family transporter [Xinfangfangia sp. CPCC 101601]